MPYIVQEWRDRIDPHIKALTGEFEKLPVEEVSQAFRVMLIDIKHFSFSPEKDRKPWRPYVDEVGRKSEELGVFINEMPEFEENCGGILNYTFTMLAIHFVGNPRYSKINRLIGICAKKEIEWADSTASLSDDQQHDLIGAIRCMQFEFYHKLARPYEDKKTEENGDVF
jgi:hypothetical protein